MGAPWEKYQSAQAAGPWTKFQAKVTTPEAPKPDRGVAALEGFGQMASMGYLPHLQAVVERSMPNPTADVDAKLRSEGFDVPSRPTYVDLRDENIKRHEMYAKEVPGAYYGGQAAGLIATAPASGAALAKLPGMAATKGAGLLARTAQSAAGGAIQGALQNPGDVEGELAAGLQVDDRLRSAKTGGLLGAAGTLGASALRSGANAVKNAPTALKKTTERMAFKSSGAMLKDFRKAFGKGRVEELGREMMENGMVNPGSTFEDVAQISGDLKRQTGEAIGSIYEQVGGVPRVTSDPGALIGKLIDTTSKVRPSVKGKAFDAAMEDVLGDIQAKGADLGDVRVLNDVIGDIDDLINYSKQSNDLPAVQKGYLEIRRVLRDYVNETVDQTGAAMGDPQLATQLKALNKRYGNMTEIHGIAKDRVSREQSKNFFGLTDTIAGSATAAGLIASDPENAAEGLAKGAAVGLLSKGARKYALPVATRGVHKAASLAEKVPSVVTGPTSKAAGFLADTPTILGPSTVRALQQPGLVKDDKKEKKRGK